VKKYAVIATLLTDEELTGSYCESEGLLGHTGLSLKDKILDDVRGCTPGLGLRNRLLFLFGHDKECGWKGGDRGGLAQWDQFGKRRNKEEERKNGKNERKDLTLTGLLIEGLEDSRTAAHTKLRAERCARSSEAQFLERIFNAPVFLTVLKFRSSVHPSAIWNERAREDSLPFTPNLSGSSAPPPNEVLGKTQN